MRRKETGAKETESCSEAPFGQQEDLGLTRGNPRTTSGASEHSGSAECRSFLLMPVWH